MQGLWGLELGSGLISGLEFRSCSLELEGGELAASIQGLGFHRHLRQRY